MIITVVHYVAVILFGIAVVWRWVTFISEAISRRGGAASTAPDGVLDQVEVLGPIIPALLDLDLSGGDLGLFGGGPDLF